MTVNKNILFLPGDGIGPEVCEEAKKVLLSVNELFGLDFKVSEELVGGDAFEETWNTAEFLYNNHKEFFLLPSDVAVEIDGNRVAMNVSELPTKFPIYDIGISTLQEIRPLMMNAGCILWNGPASYFELPGFAFGTIEILNMCTESPAVTIVGGGHTSSLVSNRGVVELVTHNSTGGGACLTMLSGGSMPVVESLEKSSQKYRSILSSIDL